MKRAIAAVLVHCCESNAPNSRHMFCENEEGTWCKHQEAKREGKNYVEKPGIPLVIKKVIEPIFSDLSKDELLEKCLHEKTQNNNEAINVIIWKKLPKDVFVGRKTLELVFHQQLLTLMMVHLDF